MKIAVFTDTYLPQINGVTKTISKMREFMDRKNIKYKLFVPGNENNYNPMDNIIYFNSINFFLYPECKISIPRYRNVKTALDEFKPDLIHIVTPFSIGMMGFKYAKDNRIPMTSSYHTDFPKYLRYYNFEILENAVWHFFRWFHSQCYINFCPSIDTKEVLEDNGIKNVEIWGRGIDTDKFSPEKRSQSVRRQFCQCNDILLLYVGRIAPEKELHVLLDSIEKLNRERLKFKLLVVGDGPLRKELEGRNIPNVIFAGYKSGEELQRIYASADIFVFPSSTETYGNVILEAMASQLPVIAPFAGGLKENLIDMYNGIVFKSGDSKDMEEKIKCLLINEDLRRELGKNARNYTLTKS